MEKRQLRIDVLGTSFVIQSEESPEHLAMLSSFIRERIDEVKARYSFADPLTVALLAALNIADDLFKVREGRQPFPRSTEIRAAELQSAEIQNVTERLINRIDEALAEETPPDKAAIPGADGDADVEADAEVDADAAEDPGLNGETYRS